MGIYSSGELLSFHGVLYNKKCASATLERGSRSI
jgi:hypothetical protein